MSDIDYKKKVCKTCKLIKDISEFYESKPAKCKKCISDKGVQYRNDNKSKIKERGVKYRENNKEQINVSQLEYRQKNREKLRENAKKYHENNRDKSIASNRAAYFKKRDINIQKRKEWYQNNKKKHAEKRAEYETANKDRLRAARRKWENNRLLTDVQYRLHKTLSGRIRGELNGNRSKTDSTELLIGCTIEELKVFIEGQFKDGMTWDNWETNGWHIDHRIPLSWFNLENENCRKLAFSYKNLQPLWGTENLKKKNFYAHKLAS